MNTEEIRQALSNSPSHYATTQAALALLVHVDTIYALVGQFRGDLDRRSKSLLDVTTIHTVRLDKCLRRIQDIEQKLDPLPEATRRADPIQGPPDAGAFSGVMNDEEFGGPKEPDPKEWRPWQAERPRHAGTPEPLRAVLEGICPPPEVSIQEATRRATIRECAAIAREQAAGGPNASPNCVPCCETIARRIEALP